MTTFVIFTLVLFVMIVTPSSMVRTGRWSARGYRNWVIGAVCVYAALIGLVLFLRAGRV